MAETNDFQDVEIQYNATRIINNLRILKYIIGDEDGDNVNVVKKKHKKAAENCGDLFFCRFFMLLCNHKVILRFHMLQKDPPSGVWERSGGSLRPPRSM